MLKTENRAAAVKAPQLKSKSLERRLLSYAALPAAFVLSGGAANAAFVGPYDVANWTAFTNGDGSVSTAGAPGSIDLTGSGNGSIGGPSAVSDFTVVAIATGFVTFDWSYVTSDSVGYDLGSFLLNGVATTFAFNTASGSSTFAVNIGDTFGFRVLATDNALGRGFLNISNFDAHGGTSDIPEPTTLSLLALGAEGLALTRRRKNQS